MKEEIKGKLKNILLDIASADLTQDEVESLNNVDDFGLDSVQTLEFLLQVEDEFMIEISDEDLDIELINDLDKLASYLEIHCNMK